MDITYSITFNIAIFYCYSNNYKLKNKSSLLYLSSIRDNVLE